MMNRLGSWALLGVLGASLAVTACSSSSGGSNGAPISSLDSGDGGAPVGPSMTIESYCTARASLDSGWCSYLDKCCTAADKADVMYAPPACIFGAASPKDCIDTLTKLTAAGTTAFHGEYAQGCLDELRKQVPAVPTSCSGTHLSDHFLSGHWSPRFAQIAACRQTEQGQSKEGVACSYDVECTEGLRCRSYAGSTTDFRCLPKSQQGEPCGLQSDCDAGLSCIGKSGAKTCDTLHDVGQICTFASDCKDGLLCASGTCATPVQAGGSCASSFEACAPLLGCRFSDQTCVALGADGRTCTSSGQCEGRCDATSKSCTSICGGTW